MSKKIILEAGLVDMSDEALVKYMGTLYETIKRNAEASKNDEEIQAMKEEIKELEYSRYGYAIKTSALRLKGAREQAKVRGIIFKLPTLTDEV